MMFQDAEFWLALIQIIGVNIILSGDNAIVIALACRNLPPRQQKLGILFGAGAAVLLRVIFTIFIVYLLTVPYLKFAGGLLLLWIGVKLLTGEDEGEHVDAASGLINAIKIVLIADMVMSLDNVIAVAAAAKGSVPLLVIGLLISVPLVVYGATLLTKMIGRFPIIVVLGAALIGYISGEVMVTDPAWAEWIDQKAHWMHWAAPLFFGVVVVLVGDVLARKPFEAPEDDEAAAAAVGLFGLRALFLALGAVLVTRAPLIVAAIAGLLGYAGGQLVLEADTVSTWAEINAPLMHTIGPMISSGIAIVLVALIGRGRNRNRTQEGPAE
jgi:YjbE family integral membrane protein